MELIYHSGIKVDLNLAEVEEILMFVFNEFRFDEYEASLHTSEIIDAFLHERGRFGDIYVWVDAKLLKVVISKSGFEREFFFKHSKKISKFFLYYLKDAIKLKKRFTLLIDTLTSLPNRHYFFKELERSIEECGRSGKSFYVVFMDIKGFKFINDFYGQEVGDLVLQEVANRLKKLINDKSFLARVGADEFVLILRGDFDEGFINFLSREVSKPIKVDHSYVEISINFGIASFPKDGKTKDELLQAADLALQELKYGDYNTNILVFKKEFKDKFLEAKRLEEDLAGALERNEIFLVYQPKVSVKTLDIVGVEALVRWNHKKYGIIPNGKWVGILEHSKYLKDIGLYVLKTALNAIYNLNFMLDTNIGVSVNSDIKEITSEYYVEEIAKFDKKKRAILTIELLERKLVKYWDDLEKVVAVLRSMGIKLSFDDFGTGNTTLKYLTRILPDELKIDKSFVTNIHNSKNLVITKAIIAMGKSLNIKTTAEGVEKEEEFKVLKELGCDIIQGYYFAKPMRIDELTDFVKKWKGKR